MLPSTGANANCFLAPKYTAHNKQDSWRLPNECAAILHLRVTAGTLSAAQATGVQRVAWTLADLARHRQPTEGDVATALILHGDIS